MVLAYHTFPLAAPVSHPLAGVPRCREPRSPAPPWAAPVGARSPSAVPCRAVLGVLPRPGSRGRLVWRRRHRAVPALSPWRATRFPVAPPASLSFRLGFSISIRSLPGSRAAPGASLRSSLDVAVPAVPAPAPSRAGGQRGAGRSPAAAATQSPTPLAGSPFLHRDPFAQSIPTRTPGSGQGAAGLGRVGATTDHPIALAACTEVVV